MSSSENWGPTQRAVVTACFLGWTLDAFDFFMMIMVLGRISSDFGTDITSVTWAIFFTLAMRPIGALLFGRLADHYGRRPALMASVLLYSIMEFTSAFAPSLWIFIVLRALFGIGMGGVWGVGAALAFESTPARSRGLVSGILQVGYSAGYLLAAVAFGLLVDRIGWRGMFMVGTTPALLVLFIRSKVPESPAWRDTRGGTPAQSLRAGLRGHWLLAVYAVVLMTVFNFFSHGTQDLYPTFLGTQRGFSTAAIARIAIIYNIGGICGGLFFGTLSGRIGRRRAIALAACLALPAVAFWGYAQGAAAVATAAFVMQFMVQGAWGVVPVHLNELAPAGIRATFPGVVYQLGNLLAASNATVQSLIAVHHGSALHPDYAYSLTRVCAVVAIALFLLALFGPERRDVRFDRH
ncbi:MAG: MFS transporter [Steroidobacteraceae bacterium]|jgi:SHS family lactate transporter-like MFS transporter